MTQIPMLEIPYVELRHFVIETLKISGSSVEFKNFCNTLGSLVVKKGIVNSPYEPGFQTTSYPLQQRDENRVREIVWDLIMERILTIGDYHNHNWPWLSLTEHGKKSLESSDPVPNDISGYLGRLKKEVPQLDGIIETYLTESVRTYNINQLLSSTITLGCASERALLLLIDTFKDTFNDENKKQSFSNKISGRFIKTQFDQFDSSMRGLKGLPYELRENHANVLTGVFQMIRYNRNAAGHPTGKSVDKDTLFANLQVFIAYCKFVYSLMEFFKANGHD